MDEQWQVWANSLISAALAFAAAWFWWTKNQTLAKARDDATEATNAALRLAADHQKVLDRLSELEVRERLTAQQFSPIVTAFQAILVKQLTHPSLEKAPLDDLLAKIGPPHTLTPDESARLAVLLKKRSDDQGDDITISERDAAFILPAVMRMALLEQANIRAANLDGPSSLKMITVVSVVTDGVTANAEKVTKDKMS